MKKSILIVDDSDFDRNMLANALHLKAEFPVLEASSGEQCLEIVQNDSAEINLILMDIMMPDIAGTDLLKKIRQKFNPIELPIIMVTSKSESNDVVSCLQNGANDYITKPINFEVAISRMNTHIQLAETSQAMSKLKEFAAIDSMIATYNHEINNPLSIAIGCLNENTTASPETTAKLHKALWRIADIVKKIKSLNEKKDLEYSNYSSNSKIFKVG